MTNSNSEWRIWAKMVAVTDLVCIVMQLLVSLLFIFLAGATTVAISENKNNPDLPQEAGLVAWVLWFIVAIMIIQTGVGLWAAVQLINGTELGRDSRDAYKRSQSWQYVCFAFIVLSVITGCMAGKFIWTAIGVLVRIMFMYIVYRFMKDVQQAFITTPHQMTQKV